MAQPETKNPAFAGIVWDFRFVLNRLEMPLQVAEGHVEGDVAIAGTRAQVAIDLVLDLERAYADAHDLRDGLEIVRVHHASLDGEAPP